MTTRSKDRPEDDPAGFDAGAALRQIGTAEAGNGFQNGIAAVILGLIAALILYPIARLRRSRSAR
jgi:hypothetical protein